MPTPGERDSNDAHCSTALQVPHAMGELEQAMEVDDTRENGSLLARSFRGQVNVGEISAPVSFGPQEVNQSTYVRQKIVERQVFNNVTNIVQNCQLCVQHSTDANYALPDAADLPDVIQDFIQEDVTRAVALLDQRGHVVLCGPPKSGKTAVGNAILHDYKKRGFATVRVQKVCCHLQFVHKQGRRSIVLIDGALGLLGLDTTQYNECKSLKQNSQCLLIFTAYPHVLKEVNRREKISNSPFLSSSLVVNLAHCSEPLNAVDYVPFLQKMLDDACFGQHFAALLLLHLQGIHSLESPEVVEELHHLGFEKVNLSVLRRLASNLKGFIFSDAGPGFASRQLYDAAGLALASIHPKDVILNVCDNRFLLQHVGTSGMLSIQVSPGDREYQVLIQRLYNMMVDGQLADLCQHPAWTCPTFLQNFQAFCTDQDNFDQLVGSEDKAQGLPLLYWSAWGLSPRFLGWWVTIMKRHIEASQALSENLLSASIIVTLLAKRDEETRRFIESLISVRFNLPAGILKLPFTTPRTFLNHETRKTYEDMKDFLQSPNLCYLDNPSLPIPASLLSVSVTEDAVSVELCSQHWYLALRLLADREVDQTDRDGNTLLHIAAHKGNLEAITLAVKSGASVTATNNQGQTPSQIAKKHAPSTVFFNQSLLKACKEGNLLAVLWNKDIVHTQGDTGDTGLHVACRSGQAEVVLLLLQLGVNIKAQNRKGDSPLHCASKAGAVAVVKLLLEHGALIDIKNKDTLRPLHLAAEQGNTEVAAVLIEKGASVDQKAGDGSTPLHKAALHGKTDTVRLLLEKGATVGVRDKGGATAFHRACERGQTDIARLLHRPGTVNLRDEKGHTPLLKAAMNGHTDTVYYLLHSAHAKLTSKDKRGCTALHRACRNGHAEASNLLLQHGASERARDKLGQTPLHKACKKGHYECAKLCLHRSAVISAKDRDKKTAADLGIEKKNYRIVNMLQNLPDISQ